MAEISKPDAAMMAGPERIARFIETRDEAFLDGVFAKLEVTIIENFAPHVFAGPDAVGRWREAMGAHLAGVEGLQHSFGPACDFTCAEGVAFFCLPTAWRGIARGRAFAERGGWAFVVAQTGRKWRVKSYAWAVTEVSARPEADAFSRRLKIKKTARQSV